MRNLILLLGKTGNESHMEIIRPFLNYGNIRVQREALNTIYAVGGNRREDIFINALLNADVRLRINIVSLLGHMKSLKSIPVLLRMLTLKDRPPKIHYKLASAICAALGHIGTKEAVPILQKLADTKTGKVSMTPGDQKLRKAAEKALNMINQ